MGTRADFYIGRGEDAEWLGSIAYDGYPAGIDRAVLNQRSAPSYRRAVAMFLANDRTATLPEEGWPWPWEDSCTTDYAYAFDGGRVWASCFGHGWFDAADPPTIGPDGDEDDSHIVTEGKTAVFPNMKARQNVAPPGSDRSGIMLFVGRPDDA